MEKSVEEQKLAELIVEVLNLEDVTADNIEPEDNLFDDGLGLDSIDALEIAVAVSQNYGVHIKAEDEETKEVFRTLRSLSAFIGQQTVAG
ncbi:MAG: phosphopantetheine-binding protein [Gammaproteobacteria bacterium]|nr:phosphopantetheine-binding protein [Gammaproteobacteria bacterium]